VLRIRNLAEEQKLEAEARIDLSSMLARLDVLEKLGRSGPRVLSETDPGVTAPDHAWCLTTNIHHPPPNRMHPSGPSGSMIRESGRLDQCASSHLHIVREPNDPLKAARSLPVTSES
jgi:hypothetical protein